MASIGAVEGLHKIHENYDLSVAELVIFSLLILPLLYMLRLSRLRSLGWIFVGVFVVLQMVGAALTVSSGRNTAPGIAAVILSSVGISPLMFATLGIVRDATIGSSLEPGPEIRQMGYLIFHIAVAGGTALYAVGFANIASDPPHSWAPGVAKAGISILLVDWVILLLPVLICLAKISHLRDTKALVLASGFALLCLAVRILYTAVETFGNPLKVFTTSVAIKACLSIMEGMLIVLVYDLAGLYCRNTIRNQGRGTTGQGEAYSNKNFGMNVLDRDYR